METLKSSDQFERVRRTGRTWATGLAVLNAARNDLLINRFGFVAGKKVGKSVQRNRARRLLREAVRLRLPLLKPGWDLIWIARVGIEGKKLDAVLETVDDLLHRARLLAAVGAATTATQSRIMDKVQAPPAGASNPGTGASNSGPQIQSEPQKSSQAE